jgi:hypothetical protein
MLSSLSDDEDGGSPANIAASGASHQTERAEQSLQPRQALQKHVDGFRDPAGDTKCK